MGKKHNSGIIARFGEEIASAAESLNIDAILKLIRRYPEIISSLKEE
jgi:hypothetical protein